MTDNCTWSTLVSADVASVLEVVVHWTAAFCVLFLDAAGKLMM